MQGGQAAHGEGEGLVAAFPERRRVRRAADWKEEAVATTLVAGWGAVLDGEGWGRANGGVCSRAGVDGSRSQMGAASRCGDGAELGGADRGLGDRWERVVDGEEGGMVAAAGKFAGDGGGGGYWEWWSVEEVGRRNRGEEGDRNGGWAVRRRWGVEVEWEMERMVRGG